MNFQKPLNNFIVYLILSLLCFDKFAGAKYIPSCLFGGSDGNRSIRRLKTVFDFNSNTAIYHVKFCRENQHMCFAGRIKQSKEEVSNPIKDINLWIKLIATLKGEMRVTPYERDVYEHIYGGEDDHFHCQKKLYVMDGFLSDESLKKIIDEEGNFSTDQCNNWASCIQECVESKCQKMRLDCNWHKSCK